MELWMIADLRRQSEAFRRQRYDGHNRRPTETSMKDLRHRRARRRERLYLARWRGTHEPGWPAAA
jgi:hypothetical protein